ncbi:MAG: riboflavin synthase [Acidobacteria bacterium]|nr:riboflavin synthase [Acidobacteriota bacterium]
MFTGLVRELGRILSVGRRAGLTVLDVRAPDSARCLAIGDSLAVNGICLTVTRIAGCRVSVDASEETRRLTTLPSWRVGDDVHLEPALRVGDHVGGHFVLGHVDGTGRVARIVRVSGVVRLTLTLGPALSGQLVPKGSIAVDGVSLTLDAGPFREGFTVTLVPQTLRGTRLGRLRTGDRVNVEIDALAKIAESHHARSATGQQRAGLSVAAIRRMGWTA